MHFLRGLLLLRLRMFTSILVELFGLHQDLLAELWLLNGLSLLPRACLRMPLAILVAHSLLLVTDGRLADFEFVFRVTSL